MELTQKVPQKHAITRKQQMLITAILTTSTLQEACTQCGISDDTARRWLAIPEVKSLLDEASSEMFNQDLSRLKRLAGTALDTLKRNLAEEVPNAQQVASARILLEKSLEINKVQELERRLSELEMILKEKDNGTIRRIK